MRTYAESKTPHWSHYFIGPAIAGLISVSVLAGYASSSIWPPANARSGSAAQQMLLARFDPQGASAHDSVAHDAGGDTAADPLSDYKTALALLKKSYYGPPLDAKKTQQITYEAIRGMLDSLHDRFTNFMDPDEWSQRQIQTRGDFEGIGALLLPDDTGVKVARPIENSPAEKAGLKPDDRIVSVDGRSVRGKDMNDVIRLIKGRRGTKVVIGVQRGKTVLTFHLMRARVEPPIVQHWMEDRPSGIGHIVLSEFNEKSIAQLETAYRDLERQGLRALVFDLRSNPGGLLEVAIQVASLLIPQNENRDLKDVVVYIKESTGREQTRLLQSAEHTHRQIPLVVLVNDDSASASEIVSAAIKDYGVGTLIGERTFGKGKVQTIYPLDDGSALCLVTAFYYPPKHYDLNFKRDEEGNRVEGTGGILPDIEVKQSDKWKPEDFKDKANDTQLQRAVEFLRAKLHGLTTAQATQQVTKGH
jgi:carboxyl-terminal processing protease